MRYLTAFCTGFLNEYLSQAENSETGESLEPDTGVLAGESPSQEDDALVEDRGVNVLQNCFAVILDSLTINNSKYVMQFSLHIVYTCLGHSISSCNRKPFCHRDFFT